VIVENDEQLAKIEEIRERVPKLEHVIRMEGTGGGAISVDELVQRTLLACIQAVGRFESRSSFKTYVLGIARNQFLMSLRSDTTASFEPPTMRTDCTRAISG
jgi:DNA-directed RNA polymerase specialized sigma24 family protein